MLSVKRAGVAATKEEDDKRGVVEGIASGFWEQHWQL